MKILYILLGFSLIFTISNCKKIECQRFCKYVTGDLEFVQSYCLGENYSGNGICQSTEEIGCSVARMNFDGTILLAGGCPTPEFLSETKIKQNNCGYFDTFLEEDKIHLTSTICRCQGMLCNKETIF
uniref:Activin_recp domain-containing protein n=1 Tax=Strongyloides stercoralis TaxID=6248 RepID=A0A0K0EKD5_STRER